MGDGIQRMVDVVRGGLNVTEDGPWVMTYKRWLMWFKYSFSFVL